MTRSATVKARVTPSELAQVDILAAELQLERSDYVRAAVLQKLESPVIIDPEDVDIAIPAPRRRRWSVRRLLRRR